MRAVVVDRVMEPAEAGVSDFREPTLEPGRIELRVRAAGCNFSDILMLQGRYQERPPLPFVLGRELAGVVVQVGPGVEGFRPGDRVLASCETGAFAELAVVPATDAFPVPEAMSFAEAAALPIVYPTSYAGLVDRGGLRAGETLLVHAAAGGVGLAAVQIGKALGARVIATAGGRDKLAVAAAAGADVGIDYRREDFVERVREETAGRGADVIYDPVGGDTFDRSLRCIAWSGRLVVVGFASGRIPEVAANRIMLKNIAVTGIHWPPWKQHAPGRVAEIFSALFALHREGGIAPPIHARRPLEEVGAALAELASRGTTGKIVLEP